VSFFLFQFPTGAPNASVGFRSSFYLHPRPNCSCSFHFPPCALFPSFALGCRWRGGAKPQNPQAHTHAPKHTVSPSPLSPLCPRKHRCGLFLALPYLLDSRKIGPRANLAVTRIWPSRCFASEQN
jgi:hypothetical protein